jgi:hypothetical protein
MKWKVTRLAVNLPASGTAQSFLAIGHGPQLGAQRTGHRRVSGLSGQYQDILFFSTVALRDVVCRWERR